jgi:glycosyltransferase involved in cell wall biosynthesis
MLEAMACGVPVAAYPVRGPVDVVVEGVSGALDADLGAAIGRALRCRGPAAAPMPSISPGGEPRSCFSTTWFRSSGGRGGSRERTIPGIAAIKRRERRSAPS